MIADPILLSPVPVPAPAPFPSARFPSAPAPLASSSSRPVATLTLAYSCAASSGQGFVLVEVDLSPYDPINFAWYKVCPNTQFVSNWTVIGIFFFVLFLAFLVVYLSGCAYNYVKYQARGWDMLPGIETLRSCRHNCCGCQVPRNLLFSCVFGICQSISLFL